MSPPPNRFLNLSPRPHALPVFPHHIGILALLNYFSVFVFTVPSACNSTFLCASAYLENSYPFFKTQTNVIFLYASLCHSVS